MAVGYTLSVFNQGRNGLPVHLVASKQHRMFVGIPGVSLYVGVSGSSGVVVWRPTG